MAEWLEAHQLYTFSAGSSEMSLLLWEEVFGGGCGKVHQRCSRIHTFLFGFLAYLLLLFYLDLSSPLNDTHRNIKSENSFKRK